MPTKMFEAIPSPLADELTEYDQDEHEFVLLLKEAARLKFDDELQSVELKPGDYLTIPAHRRHRVEWPSPDEPTVWLALHYG